MLLLAICLVLAEPPLSERIVRMESNFAALEKSFQDELRGAKQDKAKVARANKVYWENRRAATEQMADLIKSHPDDPAALDGALVLTGAMGAWLDEELSALVLRNRDDPRMGRLCFNLIYRGGEPWAESIVEAVAGRSSDREVKGRAIYCRGMMRRVVAFPFGSPLPQEICDGLVAEARGCFGEVVKSYANLKTPDGEATIGEKAARELKRLDNLPNLKVGGVAPEIAGVDLEGRPLRLSDHRGKVVVLVFWGSWCGPCMAMVPHERELWERRRDRPFALLGVNSGDTLEQARKTVDEKQMTWPSFRDGDAIRGPIGADYDIQRWPSVFVIDPKGVIRHRDVRGKALEEAVDDLLAETK